MIGHYMGTTTIMQIYKEEYDMEFMNYEYSGYRAGYSYELYSWYIQCIKRLHVMI